jgi:hypothetical protein
MQIFYLLILFIFQFHPSNADTTGGAVVRPPAADTARASADTLILRQLPQQAFAAGEILEYEVKFGALSAGQATLSIPDTQHIVGRPCFHIVSKMWTNDFFSRFFRVEDFVESFVDIQGIFPWRFHKQIREGKYRANRTATFDHVRGVVYESKRVTPIPPFSQDVLSIFYYIRTQELRVGHPLQVESYADKKQYPLDVQVLKREKIKVPAGKFDCLLLEPAMRSGTIFEQKGKMWIWYSNDQRRLPVLIKSRINVVGSLTMELKKITPGASLPPAGNP